MPKTGDINQVLGVYRNICCGREVVIRAGASFPECSEHPLKPAMWLQVEAEIFDSGIFGDKKKSDPAA